MNKTLRSSTREVIYNVSKRCVAEYEAGTILTELDNVYRRTAVITGYVFINQLGTYNLVRLPPYHCDLNPIELVWAIAKHKIASRNVSSIDVKEVAEQAFADISVEDWRNSCQHVEKIEKDYYERGNTLYQDIDRLVINVQDDNSTDESSEYSEVEYLEEESD